MTSSTLRSTVVFELRSKLRMSISELSYGAPCANSSALALIISANSSGKALSAVLIKYVLLNSSRASIESALETALTRLSFSLLSN